METLFRSVLNKGSEEECEESNANNLKTASTVEKAVESKDSKCVDKHHEKSVTTSF